MLPQPNELAFENVAWEPYDAASHIIIIIIDAYHHHHVRNGVLFKSVDYLQWHMGSIIHVHRAPKHYSFLPRVPVLLPPCFTFVCVAGMFDGAKS